MTGYGEPWHCVREMRDNGPDGDPTHVAVDHYPGETDPENGSPVLESSDSRRLARAVACVNFLAGVPDEVLSGKGVDAILLGLLKSVLVKPADDARQCALADSIFERVAGPVI